MTAANERRLEDLERGRRADGPGRLPVVLPDTATNAELDELRRRGLEAYRQDDLAFVDLFV